MMMSTASGNILPAPTIRIFVDFDGTISPQDVGADLFRRLCGDAVFDTITGRWLAGEFGGVEMYRLLAAAAAPANESILEEMLNEYDIDPAFPAFVQWCGTHGYPVTILSDGFDAYIDPMLARHGLRLPVCCNTLRFEQGSVSMDFPFSDERCPRTANCKANHVALLSRDEDIVVYAGDGRSDFEAAAMADLVFARGVLETHCQKENITFRRFSTFNDVRIILSGLISQSKLRRRKHAELMRRQLWSSG
jgi:2-hydroxy-3-keto-5-methylthiopentenyl-1-phosphate phosphatase